MNLVLDVGNTWTKVAVFDKNKIVYQNAYKILTIKILDSILKKYLPTHSIIANVGILDTAIIEKLQKKTNNYTFNKIKKFQIINQYKTPHTLGNDRLAGAIAAKKLYPKKNVLIIDIGTAINMDFVDKNGIYYGGSISPGINMRFKALHTFTQKLPLIENWKEYYLIGDDTKQSIISGVINGAIAEVKGMIEAYMKKYDKINVILTGGDSNIFKKEIKYKTTVIPDLVLIGLNETLNLQN